MWEHITVGAGGRSVEVPRDLRARLAPLLASRDLPAPRPPAEYGLDQPQAQLSYRGGQRVEDILVGSANFDRHFFYLRRGDAATVYLVPADALRPVLALVGVTVAPPD
jgi:hypothetical protein